MYRRARFCAILIALAGLLQACHISFPLGPGGDRGRLAPEVIEPAEGLFVRDEILMIPLAGIVETGGQDVMLGEPGMLVGLKDRLRAAEDNPRIKAVILRIDSPGGTVTAADLIVHEIQQFKERTKLPVVALMTDVAASGGVYIAMAADEVYALPTTLTGSIGVIMMLPGLQGLSKKVGFEMRVIKSGDNKDLGSPWRELSPEQRKVFQEMIDTLYARFLKVILDSRGPKGMQESELRALADGRVFSPEVAQRARLIDGILYPEQVFQRARELAGVDDARVISYEYPFRYRGHFYARGGAPMPQAAGGLGSSDLNLFKLDLGGILTPPGGAQFHYLWVP